MNTVTVYKQDPSGRVTWQYQGRVISRGAHSIVIEASFNRDDMPFEGIILKRGDRFVETFYDDRWFNVFAIYDRDDGELKGWYCNIGRPAVIGEQSIAYIDLALDLWVRPDGRQAVLDEGEFSCLDLDPATRQSALAALEALKGAFRKGAPPA